MNESQYRTKLETKLRKMFPGCVILHNDPSHIQGIPDIIVLFRNKWAMLEIKMSNDASIRPNQEYYVELLKEMSFASFINPQNEEDVLDDLQFTFGVVGSTRIS